MRINLKKVTPEMREMLRRCGANHKPVAMAAQYELSKNLEEVLRKGVLNGDIVSDIFESRDFVNGESIEFPLDFFTNSNAKEFGAYTMPNHGLIPYRTVEGDYLMVPTFNVANSIDWLLKYSRDARWDIAGRAMDVLEGGFVRKMNVDGWQTLIKAGYDRNVVVYDADANAGQFTKRLVSLLKIEMRRRGGGNSASTNRGKLTDLYVSPEAMEDMRNWGVDQLDEVSRREIYVAEDGKVSRVFSVNLHDIDELGNDQQFQKYWEVTLAGTMGASDEEIVVGLDKDNNDSFVWPWRQHIEIYEDDNLHRQGKEGHYGRGEYGVACLNNARVLIGSM